MNLQSDILYYAGIGSRITPVGICIKLTALAARLEKLGFVLRSGGAIGADTAYEKGVTDGNNKRILKAKHATSEAIELASTYHPNWTACDGYAKKLHGRNAMLILGENLDSPVKFVVAWSPADGVGGTALGISIAKAKSIPVFNVRDPEKFHELEKFLITH